MKIARIVFLVLGVAALLGAVWFAHGGYQLNQRLHWMLEARTMEFPCDLARRGSYRGTFSKQYGNHHYDEIRLEVDPPFTSIKEAEERLAGLMGWLRARGAGADNMVEITFDASNAKIWEDQAGQVCCAFWFRLPELGDYAFELEVVKAAIHLGSRSQRIEGRYQLCGLEWFAVILDYGFGVLLALLSIGCFALARKLGQPKAHARAVRVWEAVRNF